ncbi:MAG TPA: hypothetical protein VFO85_21540, partial [Vicinamibacteria bacterium]|nr:hypothetical protein [Vicinamibacteria bacterium]
MATVRGALIEPALREIGVLAGGESAQYHDANDALGHLNRMVDQMAAERLLIYHMGRYEFPITANYSEYRVGVPSEEYDSAVADGFDTTWTAAPPEWAATTTSSGTVSNETTIYQAGGHSVKLAVPGLGISYIQRDFTVFSGEASAISVYIRDNALDFAEVFVQCVETSHWLSSAGGWQASQTAALSSNGLGGSFALRSLSFTAEDESVVGGPAATLRVQLYIDSFVGEAYFDTFTLTNTVPDVVVPGINIPRPLYIERVHLLDTAQSPDYERPLMPLTHGDWARVSLKAQTSTQPTSWYYNPSLPTEGVTRATTFPYGLLTL